MTQAASQTLTAWIDGVGLIAPGLPDWATAQLKTATAEHLDLWADRVLDAASLTDIFGGH